MHNLEERDVTVTSAHEKVGVLTGPDELEMNHIYKGKNVRITKESVLVGSFLCSFENIYQYPFDTETCSIRMSIMGNDYHFTKLNADVFRYIGKDMMDF